MKTLDLVNHSAIISMRDPELSNKVSESLAQNMTNALASLQPFIDAAKGESVEEI